MGGSNQHLTLVGKELPEVLKISVSLASFSIPLFFGISVLPDDRGGDLV